MSGYELAVQFLRCQPNLCFMFEKWLGTKTKVDIWSKRDSIIRKPLIESHKMVRLMGKLIKTFIFLNRLYWNRFLWHAIRWNLITIWKFSVLKWEYDSNKEKFVFIGAAAVNHYEFSFVWFRCSNETLVTVNECDSKTVEFRSDGQWSWKYQSFCTNAKTRKSPFSLNDNVQIWSSRWF